jgi:hypothetical protein
MKMKINSKYKQITSFINILETNENLNKKDIYVNDSSVMVRHPVVDMDLEMAISNRAKKYYDYLKRKSRNAI